MKGIQMNKSCSSVTKYRNDNRISFSSLKKSIAPTGNKFNTICILSVGSWWLTSGFSGYYEDNAYLTARILHKIKDICSPTIKNYSKLYISNSANNIKVSETLTYQTLSRYIERNKKTLFIFDLTFCYVKTIKYLKKISIYKNVIFIKDYTKNRAYPKYLRTLELTSGELNYIRGMACYDDDMSYYYKYAVHRKLSSYLSEDVIDMKKLIPLFDRLEAFDKLLLSKKDFVSALNIIYKEEMSSFKIPNLKDECLNIKSPYNLDRSNAVKDLVEIFETIKSISNKDLSSYVVVESQVKNALDNPKLHKLMLNVCKHLRNHGVKYIINKDLSDIEAERIFKSNISKNVSCEKYTVFPLINRDKISTQDIYKIINTAFHDKKSKGSVTTTDITIKDVYSVMK